MIARGFDDGLSGWFGLAARHDGDLRMSTWVPVHPGLRDEDGTVRLATLAFAADAAVGLAAGLAALPDWVVTTDLALHAVGSVGRGPLRTEAVPLRRGRGQVLAEARIVDEGAGDALVAVASANHAALTPEGGPPMDLLPVGEVHRSPPPPPGTDRSLDSAFGAVLVAPGRAELAMGPQTRNPWGILHGALHVLLAELAAASIAPGLVSDLVVRFAAPVRAGPAIAVAEAHPAGPERTVVRVEVRDAGADRLASHAVLAVAGAGPVQAVTSIP